MELVNSMSLNCFSLFILKLTVILKKKIQEYQVLIENIRSAV